MGVETQNEALVVVKHLSFATLNRRVGSVCVFSLHQFSQSLRSSFRSTWNTNIITGLGGLGMCKVCTEAVHSVALGTRKQKRKTVPRFSGRRLKLPINWCRISFFINSMGYITGGFMCSRRLRRFCFLQEGVIKRESLILQNLQRCVVQRNLYFLNCWYPDHAN